MPANGRWDLIRHVKVKFVRHYLAEFFLVFVKKASLNPYPANV